MRAVWHLISPLSSPCRYWIYTLLNLADTIRLTIHSPGGTVMSIVLDHESASASAPLAGRLGHLPYAFFEGRIVPIGEARVSVATHALQYGTSAFGGIRGYLSADGRAVHLFRLQDHYRRFVASGKILRIGLP